jgi:hypothetical protein
MDIEKNAQNSRALRRTRRESVNMQKVITLVQGKLAACFLLGPKAGVIKLHLAAIRRQKLRDKCGNFPGERFHDRLKMIAISALKV